MRTAKGGVVNHPSQTRRRDSDVVRNTRGFNGVERSEEGRLPVPAAPAVWARIV